MASNQIISTKIRLFGIRNEICWILNFDFKNSFHTYTYTLLLYVCVCMCKCLYKCFYHCCVNCYYHHHSNQLNLLNMIMLLLLVFPCSLMMTIFNLQENIHNIIQTLCVFWSKNPKKCEIIHLIYGHFVIIVVVVPHSFHLFSTVFACFCVCETWNFFSHFLNYESTKIHQI